MFGFQNKTFQNKTFTISKSFLGGSLQSAKKMFEESNNIQAAAQVQNAVPREGKFSETLDKVIDLTGNVKDIANANPKIDVNTKLPPWLKPVMIGAAIIAAIFLIKSFFKKKR